MQRHTDGLQQRVKMADDSVSWSDVVGLVDVKDAIMSTIITPLRTQGCNMPFTSVLICGPPGTGKTYLRKALEHEVSDVASFNCKNTMYFINKFKGFSKHLLKGFLQRSTELRPTVIWLDDLFSTDCTFPCAFTHGVEGEHLQRYLTYWMKTDDIHKEGVVLVGSTQSPWVANENLIKSFHHQLYTGKLDEESRYQLIQRSMKNENHVLTDDDLWMVAQSTSGLTGADIRFLVCTACREPLRRITKSQHFKKVTCTVPDNQGDLKDNFYHPCEANDEGAIAMPWTEVPGDRLLLPEITMHDFLKALSKTRSSVADEDWLQLFNFKFTFYQPA